MFGSSRASKMQVGGLLFGQSLLNALRRGRLALDTKTLAIMDTKRDYALSQMGCEQHDRRRKLSLIRTVPFHLRFPWTPNLDTKESSLDTKGGFQLQR